MRQLTFLLLACCFVSNLLAQQTFPQAAPSDQRTDLYALTNATIYTDYKTRIENATIVVRQGRVEAVGQKVTVPADAAVIDCTGKNIYPAFIDAYAAGYGLPAPKAEGVAPLQKPQQLSNKRGAYSWNEALKPEFSAASAYANEPKAPEEWRKLGFATLLTHRVDGISRGTGAVVCLSDLREHENLLSIAASHQLSFRKGTSTQEYPSSLMGCIALLRQTYIDGNWYKTEGYKTERNFSLDAWNAAQALPQIFEAGDKLDVLRIAQLGKEFGTTFIVKTAGDEYQRLAEIKATGLSLIVPLNFPEGYDVRDPFDAQNISLAELKHWELAPSNAARLEAAGVNFALTSFGLKDKNKFGEAIRKAIEYGLSEEMALKALTYTPAQLLRIYDQTGSLEVGKLANFMVTSGAVFKAETKIYQTWAKGKPFIINDMNGDFPAKLYGEYTLTLEQDMAYPLFIQNKKDTPDAYILNPDSSKTKVSLTFRQPMVVLTFSQDTATKKQTALSGTLAGTTMSGRGTRPDGQWIDWSLTQTKASDGKQKPIKPTSAKQPETGEVIYPFIAFGQPEKPRARTVLIQNATVWTGEKDGILANADVLISGGKIQKIGRKLPVQDDAIVVNGTGKHLTAGIIDEHSHIAVSRSINEGTQESSAEVRIGDALDSEDIDIYRQLAGGVTSSHLLHGSSNPIGGQTQLIKLRWGAAPEDLKFQNWPGFIKFALGENVKQANWGNDNRSRYPQTRMGVEQVYVDYFTRAQEYLALKKSGRPYRRDLELEALGEIIESRRFITCHSYVQSEIVMMMRVAERFGFKLNTFTHILEGYKVADKMAKHGAAASTFSDWWAYKMEVYEAIPYNAAMMHQQGVLVAINSDDAEMARRLNQEAAKVIEYGNVSETDAWKMVTLNPAKMLHVDDRVGSIKIGKDADLVLWNVHPLSVYAHADQTWVDGTLYFDREADGRLQIAMQTERARIIQKMQATGKGGPGGEKTTAPKQHYHCDSDLDEGN